MSALYLHNEERKLLIRFLALRRLSLKKPQMGEKSNK
jgi:hypothetical protein